MTQYGKHPPRSLIEDPGDPVWHWFIFNGPHGSQFKWHSEVPAVPRDIELLNEFIARNTESNAAFADSARAIALRALQSENTTLVRKGIQVLAVLGTETDLELVVPFTKHPQPTVAVDARCCLFERGIKPPKKRLPGV